MSMEACFAGICGAASSSSSSCEVILPEGKAPIRPGEHAPEVPLLLYEAMFTRTPLAMASYPVIALRLAKADPAVLKRALAKSLASHPMMAGRINGDSVFLTNQGVPFTVVESPEAHAPERMEELQLLRFADFRRAYRVKQGLEPLATFRLTRFRDGSAVLGFCRSHALLDGSSAWAFLAHWARAARGEAEQPPLRSDRGPLKALLPDEKQFVVLAQERFGRPLKTTAGMKILVAVFPIMCRPYDAAFLAGLLPDLKRPRVFFSDEELARIKAAATPAPGSGDGWVSTQEALCAYILWAIARTTLPATSKGRACIMTIFDSRKALGLRPDHCFGAGLVFMRVDIEGIHQKSLREVGGDIHEEAKRRQSQEDIRKAWILHAGAAERGMEFDVFSNSMPRPKDYDVALHLNNQSKRELPDFGLGSGGVAQAVLTNAGPSLVLPAKGGIEIFFDSTTFASARNAAGRAAAVAALRSMLPGAGR